MDFFARQDQARRKTKWLILYFGLAVVSLVLMIYGVALVAGLYTGSRHHYDADTAPFSLWNPLLFLEVAAGTIAVIFLGSAYKTMALSEGGSAVAESLGGRPVAANTADPDERKLLNVVEEMAIASGVPMPKVYVLEEEEGINAFAAGHTPSDAVVAVTRNCMKHLTRDELQGVIGHEFSHILNGDMRLNLRLIGILFGIFCIATIGRILLQVRSSRREKNPLPLVGLLLLVIGALGVFFGRLIQAAVSRQREFLADASSVQFTRNPAGLSGALQKIGGYGSVMASPHAADASHLFFASGFSSSFFNLMATHPPLEERIRAIDPTWDGKFRGITDHASEAEADRRRVPARPGVPPLLPNVLGTVIGGVALGSEEAVSTPIRPHTVLPNLGNPTAMHLKYAEEMRNALPDSLQGAVREPLDATAVIYALLLSQDETLRAKQFDELAGHASRAAAEKAMALYPDVAKVATHARLPLINLALPALRQLDASQFSQFSKTLEWLIDSDGQVELFEFVVQKIVLRHLDPHFNGARRQVAQFYTLKPLVPDCAVILSALAYVGSDDPAAIAKAFATGAPYLYAPEDSGLGLLSAAQCGIEQLDAALNRLALAVPNIKRNLLQACAQVVGADGVIQESEAELLRAVGDTLDCPMPPLGVSEEVPT
jgi:Zn-dependent protease with chaperone function